MKVQRLAAGAALVWAAAASESAQRLRQPGYRLAADAEHGLSTRAVQEEVEEMAARAERLDAVSAADLEGALEDVEAALEPRAAADVALEGEISAERAKLCAEHGFESQARKDCEAYMQSACLHRQTQQAPAQAQAPPALVQVGEVPEAARPRAPAQKVSAFVCKRFFREVAETASRFESHSYAGAAPAPAPAGMLSPSPAPGPTQEGQPWYHMDPEEGLPENGVDGPLVDHDDQETQTSDWQQEFGPGAGHKSFEDICKNFPDNEWCQLHTHYHGLNSRFPRLSAAVRPGGSAVLVLVAAAAALRF